jgi:putative membrane protein
MGDGGQARVGVLSVPRIFDDTPGSSVSVWIMTPRRANWILVWAVLPFVIWSNHNPHDRLTWWMEVLPVPIGFIALGIAARRGWRMSTFALAWIGFHMVVLLVGGHYTYARVPLGDWVKEWFGSERNHYDRLGHLLQGIVPAIVCREILVRNRVFARRGWLNFTVISFVMAFSACYELIEWGAAMVSAEAAESFLGTQGDNWDTQKDMFLAGIGCLIALPVLRPLHDRSIGKLREPHGHGN